MTSGILSTLKREKEILRSAEVVSIGTASRGERLCRVYSGTGVNREVWVGLGIEGEGSKLGWGMRVGMFTWARGGLRGGEMFQH